MSEQDKALLDEHASLVRAVYRALPEEEIPAEIERRILANAAAAIEPASSRPWLQWTAPLASAAVVLLVVGIVMQPQSQREMVPESRVMVDLQQVTPPPPVVVAAPTDEPTPRMMAEKPDVSARPKALEDARVRSSRPPVVVPAPAAEVRAPVNAMTTTTVKPAPEREESVSAAFPPPAAMYEARKQGEADREQAVPAVPEAAGTSAADAAITASKRSSLEESRRSNSMRGAPLAAAQTLNRAVPALDISPELRARLDKLLSARQKADASANAPVLDELRREYPGVDIDAALRALEEMSAEGAE
jgi:hypothetical protein